jgi:hypothetical protein
MTRGPGERTLVRGPVGNIEVAIDPPLAAAAAATPDEAPRGVALVAHPHPLFGGTLDNKVAQTLARTFSELGYVALRPNFRGVGATDGAHDHGDGEADDLIAVLALARERYGERAPVLAGFSFGAYVVARVAQRVVPERMVVVGMADGLVTGGREYHAPQVPADTVVIHGELDETVPLANVLAWARPQELPVTVMPNADHFFHRRLHLLKAIIKRQWNA